MMPNGNNDAPPAANVTRQMGAGWYCGAQGTGRTDSRQCPNFGGRGHLRRWQDAAVRRPRARAASICIVRIINVGLTVNMLSIVNIVSMVHPSAAHLPSAPNAVPSTTTPCTRCAVLSCRHQTARDVFAVCACVRASACACVCVRTRGCVDQNRMFERGRKREGGGGGGGEGGGMRERG